MTESNVPLDANLFSCISGSSTDVDESSIWPVRARRRRARPLNLDGLSPSRSTAAAAVAAFAVVDDDESSGGADLRREGATTTTAMLPIPWCAMSYV